MNMTISTVAEVELNFYPLQHTNVLDCLSRDKLLGWTMWLELLAVLALSGLAVAVSAPNTTSAGLVPITFGPSNLPGFEMGSKNQSAVIVVQEFWGVTDSVSHALRIVKAQAELLARQGFRVLIPDLYKGKVGLDVAEARHICTKDLKILTPDVTREVARHRSVLTTFNLGEEADTCRTMWLELLAVLALSGLAVAVSAPNTTSAGLVPITFGPSNLPGFEMGSKNQSAVIVVQEFWGVTDSVSHALRIVKAQAELLARQGFRVLIPDLYKGKVGLDVAEARHAGWKEETLVQFLILDLLPAILGLHAVRCAMQLQSGLNYSLAVQEIGQAAEYLNQTGSPRIGITGFCMGGALSFAAAQKVPLIVAAAPNYGTPNPQQFQVEEIKIPILATFGGKDRNMGFSDPAVSGAQDRTAATVAQKIRAAGGNIDLRIFPSAPHGFLNQIVGEAGVAMVKRAQNGTVATDEDVRAAWDRIITFFQTQLQTPA
ncbi:hypothetical protein QJQ45_029655 [Haematococcus lacustris]|nr:hypothetical protein QJQ45_029655 [Haematococcus lacustris]